MNCQMETDSMNDFRMPENDKHAEPRCAPHSRSQHGRRSAKGIAFKWILPVAMLSAGVRLAAAEATDDAILRGWGDIKGTVRAGMFASYTRDWLSVRGSISDDIGGHHEGVLASLAVEAKYHVTPRLTLSIGPEVTWVNDQYAQTFFGISAAQSEIAGVAPYRARSGIETVGGSAGATYRLTDAWSL